MANIDPEVAKITEANRKLNSVFHSDIQEVKQLYDDKAQTYDQQCITFAYCGPKNGAQRLDQFLKQYKFGTDCKILDVGSGTGLVGEQLKLLNYINIDALEPSEKSNDIARSKGIYKTFSTEFLGPGIQISIPSNTYDAAICIGVFIPAIMKAEGAMDEMVRVVKPGGLICFSLRDDVMFDKEYGNEQKMAQLCENNSWKLVSKTKESYLPNYKECYIFVYQVLEE